MIVGKYEAISSIKLPLIFLKLINNFVNNVGEQEETEPR